MSITSVIFSENCLFKISYPFFPTQIILIFLLLFSSSFILSFNAFVTVELKPPHKPLSEVKRINRCVWSFSSPVNKFLSVEVGE